MPGKIHVPVTVATNGFDKLQRTFGRLKGVALGVTAALGGLAVAARAIDFTGAAVQGARDLERNYAGLESVFKDNTEQMREFGRAASDLGLSMSEAAKATTFIGSVLKQSGFAIQETSDLTEELVSLGADLALTYGYDIQESLLAMTALFRGEYDPIEKFGVAMKQSEIDAEKLARGLDHLTGAEERFADQQIRVEFLMERAADAIGAVDRQSENLTVQQMRLRAEFENIRDTVAADLLPVLADFTGGIREIVDDAGPGLEEVFSELAPVLDAFGKELLPLIQAGVEGIIQFSGEFVEFFREALDPTSELNQSFRDLGEAIGELFSDVDGNVPTMSEQFDAFTIAVTELNDSLTVIIETADTVADDFKQIFGSITENQVSTFVAITATIGLLATNLDKVAKVAKKLPKGGLIGIALFGAAAIGSDHADAVEEAHETIANFQGTLEEFAQQNLTTAEAQALNEVNALKLADSMGALTDEYYEAYPEAEKLARMHGIFGERVRDADGNLVPLIENMSGFRPIVKDMNTYTQEYTKQLEINAIILERNAKRHLDAQLAVSALREEMAAALGFEVGKPTGFIKPGLSVAEALGLADSDDPETGPSAVATDYVAEFFDGIAESIAKEAAKLDLQELGLSEALIDQILGSQGWEDVFDNIVKGGAEMARQLQDDFNRTAKGIDELAKAAEALQEELDDLREEQEALQQQILDTQAEQAEALAEATEAFEEYKQGIDNTVTALDTYERAIGRFESQTRSDLDRITTQINDAFDNGYLLEDARNNLLEYARAELNVLMQIQRQRDDLLAQRNAAAETIFGIAQAVTSAGNITRLLRDVQDEVKEVQVKELFEDVVQSADGLKDFKVTVERNYTDVITNTVSKSQALVNGFQDVVDRTRAFIDNLKILREMGLDPFLFNQLVDAGAEAGGATAAALVEGGKDTVNEVNQLQGQLEAMGVELGEQTYEVTKNSGEQFVSGIIDGLDAQLEALELQATEIAEAFTETFATMMTTGLETAFDDISETIMSEFDKLIAELKAKLEEIKALRQSIAEQSQGYTDPVTVVRDSGSASTAVFDPITGELLRSYTSSDGSLLEGGIVNPDYFADYPGSGMGESRAGNTFINNIIQANNPLDAYNAAKGNVLQQSNFQSANGSIQGTLSGVGS